MSTKKNLFAFLVLLCGFLAVNIPAAYSEYITGSGCSVSNVGYLSELANEYEKRTGVKMFIRGGGTVTGLEDLSLGKVDFAASCRNRASNDPEDVEFIQVAWDALVFIVHKENPRGDISLDTVRAIYAGQITNWKQLKGKNAQIVLFLSRPKRGLSGLEASTKEMVLKGKEPVTSLNTVSVASGAMVEQMVEKTPEGFGIAGFSSARKRDVKMLKVNGVAPIKGNIANKRYPLRRPLFFVVPKNLKPEIKQFVDFTLSKEGQKFISSLGAVSLIDAK